MERLLLEIVTPERKVLTREVDEVNLPGVNGEMGILPGHTELLSVLRPGPLTFRDGQDTDLYSIAGGFAEVGHEKVVVLADAAESAAEIDIARAEAALGKAEKKISDLEVSDESYAHAEAAFARASVRIEIAGMVRDRR